MSWYREITDLYRFECDPDGHGVQCEFALSTGPRTARISAIQIHVIDQELARRRQENGEQ